MGSLYMSNPECLLVLFDLAQPDGPAALQRQRDALAGHTTVEDLGENMVALIVYPGWVSRAAA
jgi:hypothetical protein